MPCKNRYANPFGRPFRTALGASASAKIFKCLMVDIGIMRALAPCRRTSNIRPPISLKIYNGAMAEQLRARKCWFPEWKPVLLSRFAKSSSAEVDYIASINGSIVRRNKSAAEGRLKSLHLFLDTYKNCPRGWCFHLIRK